MKRKTPVQLQALEGLFSEEKYPEQRAMEDLGESLGLTLKEVRGWFIEKRRRVKRENEMILPSHSVPSKKIRSSSRRKVYRVAAARKMVEQQEPSVRNRKKASTSLSSVVANTIGRRQKSTVLLQDLLTPSYILTKVFRKDGPPLGMEFESLPSRSFLHHRDSGKSHPDCQENQRAAKRRKVSKLPMLACQNSRKGAMVKKHGIGKGLMTVWRVTNPDAVDFPTGIDSPHHQVGGVSKKSTSKPRKPLIQKKRPWQQVLMAKQKSLGKQLQNMRKPSTRRREVESNKGENLKQPHKKTCELALEGERSAADHLGQFSMLVDDEELELRELQAGPNPPTCSNHIATNGLRGCSLCKDMLAKFPPNSVRMKQPFNMKPWDSSPEIIKKLFKVFHFLYTHAIMLDICSFTLDEFAQAFHDKDSVLLGKVHLALLQLLLSDVETELSIGVLPHLGVSCKFLALVHSLCNKQVDNQEFVIEFWKKSLNPLTWTEILRQILVSAGFGSKKDALQREALSKEMNRMVKYGLRPGTLKDELFRLLLEKGKNGYRVSELAKSLELVEPSFASTREELELLICSTLSSDITLFEKISSSAYRLRNSISNEVNDIQSDTENSGSVDDSIAGGAYHSGDDSECDSGNSSLRKVKQTKLQKCKTVYTEIDESHPGEVWLLGLTEGEYSDLSTDEKLNALVALIDLLSSGSSIRMEDPTTMIVDSIPNIRHRGSGAKIKRSSSKQRNLPRPSWNHLGQMHCMKEPYTSECRPIDSSASISKFYGKAKSSCKQKDAKETEVEFDLHPMQSLFLGSDRRYNRYWLFLGPCNVCDPGHKRIYFESSEDGHWEVIDTEEALCALLSVLDDRGAREAVLINSLEKRETVLRQAMSTRMSDNARSRYLTQSDQYELDTVREESSSPVSDVDNNLNLSGITEDSLPPGAIVLEVGSKGEQQTQKWNRIQAFDVWIWNNFYSDLNAVKYSKRSYLDSFTRCECCHDLYWRDEKHCRTCHSTFELDFDLEERYAIHSATCRVKEDNDTFPKHKVLSSHLQSLKAATHAIESVMPEKALVGAWRKSGHRLWVKRLRRTSSLAELLQVIADFVGAINVDWWSQSNSSQGYDDLEEIITCFPSLPQTSSGVALWLVKLDTLLAPYLKNCLEKNQEISTRSKGKCARKQ